MRFAIIGAAAYIAPKHLAAIKACGHYLVAALDLYDNVGVLDSYAPECKFFTEFERFDRFVDKCRRRKGQNPIDWLVVCSPNYLHDAHIRFGLRSGLDVLCEKPLVLAPWNLDGLHEMEQESGKRVWTVLQLRHHQAAKDLKASIDPKKIYNVELTYVTPRGPWFNVSWKGKDDLAGGIITNIGIHFLDLLMWVFGSVEHVKIHYADPRRVTGYLRMERARVKWFLSTAFEDAQKLNPNGRHDNGAIRGLTVDGQAVDLSTNFRDLHGAVYRKTLAGEGHGIEDARPSITLCHKIQQIKDKVSWPDKDFYGTAHPLAKNFIG